MWSVLRIPHKESDFWQRLNGGGGGGESVSPEAVWKKCSGRENKNKYPKAGICLACG